MICQQYKHHTLPLYSRNLFGVPQTASLLEVWGAMWTMWLHSVPYGILAVLVTLQHRNTCYWTHLQQTRLIQGAVEKSKQGLVADIWTRMGRIFFEFGMEVAVVIAVKQLVVSFLGLDRLETSPL